MTENVLFKFRKIDKFVLKSLVHSEFYFARPDRLNDPFDCKVDILMALENAISRSEMPSRQNLEKLRGMRGFFEKVQTDLENMGVCSFSLELENPLMWSHYADDHRGVCLTYSLPDSFFYETAKEILGIAKVHCDINPLSDWFLKEANGLVSFEKFGISLIKKALTVKARPWEYEQEVRIVRRTDGAHAIDKRYLKQVCFGLATPEADVDLVRRILNQGGYDVALYKMQRSAESDFGFKAQVVIG